MRISHQSPPWVDGTAADGGPTSGMAPGYVQANLAILPAAVASDFMRFCQLNPKPCPLVGVSAPGFFGVDAGSEPPVFVPLHAAPLLAPRPADDAVDVADRFAVADQDDPGGVRT